MLSSGLTNSTLRNIPRSEKFVNLLEYDGPRNVCSAIYYLLEGDLFSAFHKKSDELLQFYAGCSMILHIIETDGRLGPNSDNKETFQAVVKSGSCGLLGGSARHC